MTARIERRQAVDGLISEYRRGAQRTQAAGQQLWTGFGTAHRSADSKRTRPDVPPQYRVLMPEHQQLSIFRQVAAEHQDGQAEHPAREQVGDLERHLAS
jgi:hypothetical protein